MTIRLYTLLSVSELIMKWIQSYDAVKQEKERGSTENIAVESEPRVAE
jgi:hypothetical protein